jgi:hypothetical protein
MAHHRTPDHIGGYLGVDRGGILHSTRREGVCFDALPVLQLKQFSRLQFFRFVGVTA